MTLNLGKSPEKFKELGIEVQTRRRWHRGHERDAAVGDRPAAQDQGPDAPGPRCRDSCSASRGLMPPSLIGLGADKVKKKLADVS
jgi:hypothetical protein